MVEQKASSKVDNLELALVAWKAKTAVGHWDYAKDEAKEFSTAV